MRPAPTHGTRRRPDGCGSGRVVGLGLGLVLAIALGACSGSSQAEAQGPAALSDGTYRLLATSTSQDPDPTVTMQITGTTVELTQGTGSVQATLGQAGSDEHTLCPPNGTGSPQPLGSPVEVDGVQMTDPALFGDCGQTAPVRVTLVDLSATTDEAFPFQNWAEFCDITDPDC